MIYLAVLYIVGIFGVCALMDATRTAFRTHTPLRGHQTHTLNK